MGLYCEGQIFVGFYSWSRELLRTHNANPGALRPSDPSTSHWDATEWKSHSSCSRTRMYTILYYICIYTTHLYNIYLRKHIHLSSRVIRYPVSFFRSPTMLRRRKGTWIPFISHCNIYENISAISSLSSRICSLFRTCPGQCFYPVMFICRILKVGIHLKQLRILFSL